MVGRPQKNRRKSWNSALATTMPPIKVKLPLPEEGDVEDDYGGDYDNIPQLYAAPKEPTRLRQSHAQRQLAAGLMESLSEEAGDGCRDFRRTLELTQHPATRPLWVCPDGRIVLEAASPVYAQALDLLVAISEPVSRTRHMQEYQLTQYSLYAGASMGLRTSDILAGLERFSKCCLPDEIRKVRALPPIHLRWSAGGPDRSRNAHTVHTACEGRWKHTANHGRHTYHQPTLCM